MIFMRSAIIAFCASRGGAIEVSDWIGLDGWMDGWGKRFEYGVVRILDFSQMLRNI